MRQVAVGGICGLFALSVSLASGCGGSAFSASNGSGGDPGGESGSSGMSEVGGMSDVAGMTSTAGSSTGGMMTSGGRNGGGGTTSSGGESAGGGASTAGSGGSAGGASCAVGTVNFTMTPAKGSGGAAFCTGCSANFLTVTDSKGQTVVLDRGCSLAECGACMPSACPPVACLNQNVPAEGVSRSWSETHWVDSTCGATSLACASEHCVPPGKYKAKMCALKNTTPNGNYCTPGDSPVCTEVDFVLPGATSVQGVIGG
ncbi:MAG: hypothetical protein ABUL62_09440 [Myxococcales bacterium]